MIKDNLMKKIEMNKKLNEKIAIAFVLILLFLTAHMVGNLLNDFIASKGLKEVAKVVADCNMVIKIILLFISGMYNSFIYITNTELIDEKIKKATDKVIGMFDEMLEKSIFLSIISIYGIAIIFVVVLFGFDIN